MGDTTQLTALGYRCVASESEENEHELLSKKKTREASAKASTRDTQQLTQCRCLPAPFDVLSLMDVSSSMALFGSSSSRNEQNPGPEMNRQNSNEH